MKQIRYRPPRDQAALRSIPERKHVCLHEIENVKMGTMTELWGEKKKIKQGDIFFSSATDFPLACRCKNQLRFLMSHECSAGCHFTGITHISPSLLHVEMT